MRVIHSEIYWKFNIIWIVLNHIWKLWKSSKHAPKLVFSATWRKPVKNISKCVIHIVYECGLWARRRGEVMRWRNCFVNLPFSFEVVPETKHVPQGELITFSIHVFQKGTKNGMSGCEFLDFTTPKHTGLYRINKLISFYSKTAPTTNRPIQMKTNHMKPLFLHFRCCASVNEKNTSKYCLSFFPFIYRS